MGLSEPAQPLLDHRRIGQDPAIDRAVVHVETALLEHFFQIAVAQRIAQILGHHLNNQPRLELPPFEIGLPPEK